MKKLWPPWQTQKEWINMWKNRTGKWLSRGHLVSGECRTELKFPDCSPPVLLPMDKITSRPEVGTKEIVSRGEGEQEGHGGQQESQFSPNSNSLGSKSIPASQQLWDVESIYLTFLCLYFLIWKMGLMIIWIVGRTKWYIKALGLGPGSL